MQERKF